MNAGAANVIAQGFLKGVFDVFDALLTLSFSYDTSDIADMGEGDLDTLLGTYSISMQSAILGGGAVALLLSTEETSKLATMTNTGEPTVKDTLDDADLSILQEIADSGLGGGVANLSEKFGEDVELEKVEMVLTGPDGAGALRELLGDSVSVVKFTYKADPHFDATAILIYSQSLEERVPAELVDAVFGEDAGDAGGPAGEALVSDEEMQDILSGFSPDEGIAAESGPPMAIEGVENLGVILDIELIATARLGSVDMPIAEVLSLGPGSIIEVGHLVDDPIELLVNDKLVARGDVVVVDEKFGLRITEIISREERIESLR